MCLRFPLRRALTLVSLLLVSAPALASQRPDFGLPGIVGYSGGQLVFDATDADGHGAGTTVTFTLRRPNGTIGRFSTETDEAGRFVIALDTRGLADQDSIRVSIWRDGVFTFTLGTVRLGSRSTSNARTEPWTPAFQPNENVQAAVCASETCSAGPCDPFSADLFTRGNEPMDSGVNLADGTVISHHSVLSFPTRRMGFDLRLHHQSMTGYPGPVGNGWSHSFNMFIVQTEDTKGSVVTPDLRVFPIFGGGPTQVPGEWEPPEGFFSRLRQDRARNRWVLTHHTGVRFQFLLASQGLPGPLIQIDDTNGNATRARLDPSGFLSTVETDLGQTVRFGYGAGGRLASVTDPLGRTWTFSHDPLGNLTAVTSPQTETADVAAGQEITDADLPAVLGIRVRTTRFFYEDSRYSDFITRIVDPRGAETRGYTYHHGADVTGRDPDEGRVEAVRINGGTAALLYRFAPDARPVPKAVLEVGNPVVRVTDREGNVTDHEIQGRSNGPVDGKGAFGLRRRQQWTESGKGNLALRPGEPDAWETRWLHDCDCLSPIEVSQPFRSNAPPHFDGNRMPTDAPVELFTYNDRRQVTGYEFRSGAGESIRWARTYDSFERFSRLLTYTEPRGFDASPIYTGLGFTHVYSYDPAGNLLTHAAPTVTRGLSGGAQPIVESWTHNAFGQVLSHRDPNGNLMSYTYFEGPGRARGVNARDGFAGYMASMTRGAPGSTYDVDLTTRFRVNALGWITERIDPSIFYYFTEYDTLGEIAREIEPEVTLTGGARATYETRFLYDAAGNRVMERRSNVDFDGTVPANGFIDRSRSFDAVGNALSERMEVDDDAGHDLVTRYAYDRNDQRSAIQKPEGNRTFLVYDERRLLFKTFYGIAPGQTVASSYPADKRTTTLSGAAFVGLETLGYDAPGKAVERQDGRGHLTRSFFDFANRLVGTRDPNGHGRTMTLDDASNVLTEDRGDVSANGTLPGTPLVRTYFRYDERNRPYETVRDLDPATDESSAVDPDDGLSSAHRTLFDAGSRVVGRLDAEGHPSTISYDTADRVVSITDALGNTRTLFYDDNSNVIQENDLQLPGPGASGPGDLYVFCYGYDPLNRRVKTRVHGLHGTGVDQMTLFAYDSRSNLRRLEDPEGSFTLSAFDDTDREIRRQRFAGDGSPLSLSDHIYDRNGNTLADVAFRGIDDPASAEVTSYTYDRLDRRIQTVHPDGGAVETVYDATSNPVTVTEQRGVRFANAYDDGNRLAAQDIALPSEVPGETRREYAYDSLDRLTRADNDFSRVKREYDPLSRLTAETQEIRLAGEGDYKEPIELRYAYDRQGNRTSLEVLDGSRSDLEVRQTFDDLNRVQSIAARTLAASAIGPVAEYAYIGPFRLQRKTLGNGAFLTETYDKKPRLARHVWQAPGGTLLAGFEYAYDDVDNALHERFLHDAGRYDNFGYNPRYELTGVSFRQSSPVDYRSFAGSFRDRFEYDDVFNRIEADFGGPFDPAPTTTDIYKSNPANEYTEIVRDGHPFVPVHDAAGNATELPVRPVSGPEAGKDVTARARYDALNRLFEIQAGSNPKQHYRYDVFGRRIAVLELDGATAGLQILAGSRRFLYDGWTDVEERLFKPNAILSEASSTLERVYVHGPRIDELLLTSVSAAAGPVEYYALDNRLGSIMALLDAHDPETVLASYRYSAYGEPAVVTGPALSSTVNPFLFTGRRLDGKTGLYYFRMRFMDSGNGRFIQRDSIGSANAYSYANNNPMNQLDPLGLYPLGHGTQGGTMPPLQYPSRPDAGGDEPGPVVQDEPDGGTSGGDGGTSEPCNPERQCCSPEQDQCTQQILTDPSGMDCVSGWPIVHPGHDFEEVPQVQILHLDWGCVKRATGGAAFSGLVTGAIGGALGGGGIGAVPGAGVGLVVAGISGFFTSLKTCPK